MNGGLVGGHCIGNLLALSVALAFAGLTVSLRRFRAFDVVPAMCIGGFMVFLVAGLFGGGFNVAPRAMPILALMGLIQFGIPLILFARGALSVPAVTLSLIALLDVGLNPLWAWIGSVETPVARSGNRPGTTLPSVVMPLNGSLT